jgi:hypothetical protein
LRALDVAVFYFWGFFADLEVIIPALQKVADEGHQGGAVFGVDAGFVKVAQGVGMIAVRVDGISPMLSIRDKACSLVRARRMKRANPPGVQETRGVVGL